MPQKTLFICTGNSARSIFAEVLMKHHGGQSYLAYSAGAKPSGTVNPLTIETLKRHSHSTQGLRSKPLEEFSGEEFDVVITVCDNARESCPVWPKRTTVLHWSLDDPATFEGTDKQRRCFFEETYRTIEERIKAFIGKQ